jgi:hypothetical protein
MFAIRNKKYDFVIQVEIENDLFRQSFGICGGGPVD